MLLENHSYVSIVLQVAIEIQRYFWHQEKLLVGLPVVAVVVVGVDEVLHKLSELFQRELLLEDIDMWGLK